MSLCKLCRTSEAIENSHVISKLVYRAIKSDSPTGFLRNPFSPNRRLQDGDKLPLLCTDCEERFSVWEHEFAQKVFLPFHNSDQDRFSYGPWFHRFLSSVAWRTLILDIPDLEQDPRNPRHIIAELCQSEELLRGYLLGTDALGAVLKNHVIAWTGGDVASPELSAVGPNVAIRRSVGGYTLIDRDNGYSAVISNLAGLICVFHIKARSRDTWRGTKVSHENGNISQPQNVRSWIMHDFFQLLIESREAFKQLSEVQAAKILDSASKNPEAKAIRFYERDRRIETEL